MSAPKHEFRVNGVDQVCSLWKLLMQLCGMNFSSSSAYFAPSFVRQPNGSKYTRIVQNAPKHEFRVQWGGSGAIVATNSDVTLCYEHLHLFSLFCTEFHKPTKLSQMHPNSTKRDKTWLLDTMGWIGCVRCEKFRRDFVETNFLH